MTAIELASELEYMARHPSVRLSPEDPATQKEAAAMLRKQDAEIERLRQESAELRNALEQPAVPVAINYFALQEFAEKHRISYNELCAAVREAATKLRERNGGGV